jgi:hypothetical protein
MKRILCGLIFWLTCAHAAHADRISGTYAFDVAYYTESGFGELAEGSGSFELRNDHVLDFELSVLDFTWTEDDLVGDCYCWINEPENGLPALPGFVRLDFANEDGYGSLIWRFAALGYFDSSISAGQYDLYANYYEYRSGYLFVVPEPPPLAIFALAFLVAVTRRRTSLRRSAG